MVKIFFIMKFRFDGNYGVIIKKCKIGGVMRLEIKNLTVKFKESTAVNNISLNIESGSLVCVLGPSGCGKSTLLYSVAGFNYDYSGNVYFDNDSIDNIEPENRNIGMVFQDYALYPHMSVYSNIEFPLKMKRIDKTTRRKMVEDIAKLVKIENILNRKPSQISGGQQQRVAIARALVKKPKLLLLDEPLSNLDARLRLEMREEIRRIQNELGITTLFVTHDQEEALSISDKIAIINNGCLEQYDSTYNLYNKPKTLFVAKFLGSPPINVLSGTFSNNTLGLFNDEVNLKVNKYQKLSIENGIYNVGIRCEDFIVCSNNDYDFLASVMFVENIGRDLIVKAKIKDEFIRFVTNEDDFDINSSKVYLKIRDKNIHVFKKDSEENILI